jgi:hypothetical protein
MLEKTVFAENAIVEKPSRVVLPPIPLTICTMIETPAHEVLVIEDGNIDSQRIVPSLTSARSWTTGERVVTGDAEKPVDKPVAEDV